MFKKVLIGALAGCVMSGTAMAGDHAKDTYDERWYMGIGAQYIDADGDERNTEDSFGGRLLLGKPVANGINLGLGLGAGPEQCAPTAPDAGPLACVDARRDRARRTRRIHRPEPRNRAEQPGASHHRSPRPLPLRRTVR